MAAPAIPLMVATFGALVLLFSTGKKAEAAMPVVDDAGSDDDPDAVPDTVPSAPSIPVKKPAEGLLQQIRTAAAAGDWEFASSLALAQFFQTGSDEAVRLVSELRKKAGLEHTSILTALKQAAAVPTLQKPKAETKTPALPKPKATSTKPAATKQTEKATKAPTATKKTEKGPKVTPPPEPKQSERQLLAELVALEIRDTKKGTEDRSLVKDYQQAAGLTLDGLYGPATAKACWEDGADLPPNPRYWPDNPDQAKASYRTFLRQMALKQPEDKAAIDALIGAL